jgi:adenylate kinase
VFSERAICPYCDGPLIRRTDDDATILETRLSEFNSKTQPVADHYGGLSVLRKIDGNRDREAVFADISRLIEQSA